MITNVLIGIAAYNIVIGVIILVVFLHHILANQRKAAVSHQKLGF